MTPLSTGINFEDHFSPNFTGRRNGGSPKILVMHYTACPTDEALHTLTSKTSQVSAHYLIPPEGDKVYRLVPENMRAWHSGVAEWRGESDVNSHSIGLENVNWGYTYGSVPNEPSNALLKNIWSKNIHAKRSLGERGLLPFLQKTWHSFPQEQMNTLALLSKEIIDKWSIDPENVVGHADVAPDRKVDPGALFDWKFLAEKGVGVWYNLNADRVHSNQPQGISVSWMQKSLQNWGYKTPQNGSLDPETKKVVEAFQMHFRQKKYDGVLDKESMDILDILLCQRKNKLDPK
ncbi:MAG TPA: N-acetylmuramoyl-L-alanine amidase [Candidatus Rhabdochlamydia sp.]|jgi:N-acetyl-anhydromuramyl-L-alanine amidase AmpD|nr:N-acetylmuramoyl-L-alanine amidase [Candidatus Rhabdochlamydia sp.]